MSENQQPVESMAGADFGQVAPQVPPVPAFIEVPLGFMTRPMKAGTDKSDLSRVPDPHVFWPGP